MRKVWILLFMASSAFGGIVPNNLDQSDKGNIWNITEQQFHDNIQLIYDVYSPIFKALDVNFWFERKWDSKQAQTQATRYDSQWTKNWKIEVHGGLARRPEVTREGFIMAICHEIGHLLGGYPLKVYSLYSTEGEAYYYGAQICARKVFGKLAKKEKLINKLRIDVDICSKLFDAKIDQNVCIYTMLGAKSFADLNMIAAQERREASLEVKDPYKVKLTNELWMPSQCVLDTMIAGLLCEKPWNDKLIPLEHNKTCTNRPECWYAP